LSNSSETRAQYTHRKELLCDEIEKMYGKFSSNYVRVNDKTENDVCHDLITKLNSRENLKMNCNDVERYVFVTQYGESTIIKK
jgi:hypothetical protein